MKKAEVNDTDRQAVRMLVRAREDFQAMRKRMDNRIGRKANGKSQNIEERALRSEDVINFSSIADAARAQEKEIEKMLRKTLERFPVYTEYLKDIKGVGEISAGWIIGEFDIKIATTVSKLWQFCGLNSGMVIGKKRVENKDGTFSYIATDKMIFGDKLTPGFVAPFNKRLRTALVGVMADGFIKAGLRWEIVSEKEFDETPEQFRDRKNKVVDGKKVEDVPCRMAIDSKYVKFYIDYKHRLENSENETTKSRGTKSESQIKWKETTKGHRDRAAKRYMIKMFLKDLYVAWRKIESLPVRGSYQEEYLGHRHVA